MLTFDEYEKLMAYIAKWDGKPMDGTGLASGKSNLMFQHQKQELEKIMKTKTPPPIVLESIPNIHQMRDMREQECGADREEAKLNIINMLKCGQRRFNTSFIEELAPDQRKILFAEFEAAGWIITESITRNEFDGSATIMWDVSENWPMTIDCGKSVANEYVDMIRATEGGELIVTERYRQIKEKGISTKEDFNRYHKQDILKNAISILLAQLKKEHLSAEMNRAVAVCQVDTVAKVNADCEWGLAGKIAKENPEFNRAYVRSLQVAGALIAAELDRSIMADYEAELKHQANR